MLTKGVFQYCQYSQNSKNVVSFLREQCDEFQKNFQEWVAFRFDDNACAITSAFSIFDPQNFPPVKNVLREKDTDRFKNYGNESVKILISWFGEPKNVNGKIFPPVLDGKKFWEQWEGFKFWMFEGFSRLTFQNFGEFLGVVLSKARSNGPWQRNFSEVVLLLEIIGCKMVSTAENERVFSKLRRIVTDERTQLSDANVAALVKISFEFRKLYANAGEALEILPKISRVLEKKLSERRIKKTEQKRKSRKRKAAQKKPAEEGSDEEMKDLSQDDESLSQDLPTVG